MNAHNPFDAKQDWTNPYCQNSSNDPMVDALLGNAYHVVRTVYCNLGNLKLIYDFLNQYGMVLGVQSEAELKALTTKATFARIYDKTPAGDRQVTDYLYVEGDRTGILPDDTTATGSWVKVATSGSSGGGESTNDGGYIPWIYNSGSAVGGETTIRIPGETAGAPFMIVNGDWQTEGYDFEYDPVVFEVSFTTPLEPGDFVVVMRTGVPATPDNPNVSDWITINWLYNQGAAVGGEQVIDIPYTFQSVPAVYKNGLRYYKGLTNNSYTIDSDNNRIILTEPLTTNDRLIVQLGGEAKVLEIVDHTIQEVARAANVKDSEVILSTDTTQSLNGKRVVFSINEQKSYGLPVLPTNVYIQSVDGDKLTYNPGSVVVDLLPVPGSTDVLANTLTSNAGASSIGTTQGTSVQEQLDKLHNIKHTDIANYGYTYGSGVDAKDFILASIADNGEAHISGDITLSRFDWPEGARLTGKSTITYTRVPNVPCVLDSEIPVNHSLMKAVYVHQVFDICDMLQIKTAGFNTLIHYGQSWRDGGDMVKACNAAEAVGLKLILGGPIYGQTNTPSPALDTRECVIGYYLFDEPQNGSVSKVSQEARITAFKAFTQKALCIAEHGVFGFDTNTHPNGYDGVGYDIIFSDAYYHDDWDDARNKRQAVLGWAELKHKCPTSRIVPCVGLFTTDQNGGSDNFKNKAKQIAFAKQFFNMGDGEYAAFSWETQLIVNTHNTITTDTDLYALGKELNAVPKQKPYDIDVYAFYTDRMAGAMQIYNDKYSSADVTPFQTINVGTAQGERQTTFKQGGIAARNTGGLLATRLKNHGYVGVELYYFNGADSANTVASLTTCIDDFYTNTTQMSFTFSPTQGAWINAAELTPNQGVGINIVPSASYNMRWKFIRGGIVDCSWRGNTF